MKNYKDILIYIFLFSVIIICGIGIYRITKREKTLQEEIYAESNQIIENIEKSGIDTYDLTFPTNSIKTSSNASSERLTTSRINAFIRIPKLDIFYPVVLETTMENLKVAPTKLWGGTPNSIGNYCIIGHNLENGELFSNLDRLSVGDTAELMDTSGYTVNYEVYDIYIVNSNDLSFTTQETDGKKEITLVTCTNKADQRLIVRCTEII